MRRKKFLSAMGLFLALTLTGAACASGGGNRDDAAAPKGKTAATSKTGAADLRAGLTGLLTEHVYLAALATGAALRVDNAAFGAWAAALNGETNSNSADIVATVGSAYGPEVGNAFNGLWRSEKHIPGFVAYTQAVAKGDKAGQDKAVADLLDYAKTFGETMNKVNSNLPAAAVEDAIKMHITTLKAVVDAQKAGDAAKVTMTTREAVKHMSGTADVLTEATVKKFPDKF